MSDGYFPHGSSVLRHVHEQKVVGRLYGWHSLFVQATDPLAFAGLIHGSSSDAYHRPYGRLTRTAITMERVYFGSKEEADKLTERVWQMHAKVRGHIDEQAGHWKAGTRFEANDPAFLLWILACLAHSSLTIYEAFVSPLTDDERERFWQDYRLVGELFGLPSIYAPQSFSDFQEYMENRLASDDLHVTQEADSLATFLLLNMPLPPHRAFARPMIGLAVIGALPERVRELYSLRWSPGRQREYNILTATHRRIYPMLPHNVKVGPCSNDYQSVARDEHRVPEEEWPEWVREARLAYRFAGQDRPGVPTGKQ